MLLRFVGSTLLTVEIAPLLSTKSTFALVGTNVTQQVATLLMPIDESNPNPSDAFVSSFLYHDELADFIAALVL